MQTIKASEFKAKCLHLMDVVNETNEEIIITKNGTPVSKLVPYKVQPPTLLGLHNGQIKSSDAIYSTDENWDAE